MLAVLVIGCGLVACEVTGTNAPDDARLSFYFPRNNRVAVGDTITVVTRLRLETDDSAGEGWTIDVSVDRGLLGSDALSVVTRNATDANGAASLRYNAPADTGWVHLSGVAGNARATDSILVVSKADPTP
jgi:hypothetical protein